MEDIKRNKRILICPYCSLELNDLDNLVAHMQGQHDYPLSCDKKYVIDRLKRIGINFENIRNKK